MDSSNRTLSAPGTAGSDAPVHIRNITMLCLALSLQLAVPNCTGLGLSFNENLIIIRSKEQRALNIYNNHAASRAESAVFLVEHRCVMRMQCGADVSCDVTIIIMSPLSC